MPRQNLVLFLIVILTAWSSVSAQTRPNTSAFEGTFVNVVPEKVGDTVPTMKVALTCAQPSGCTFTIGGSTERWDKIGPLPDSILEQARFALKYAKDRRERATLELPTLRALLESTSDISGCVDLGYINPPPGLDHPGYSILCTVNPNPWDKPAVVLLGSILAGCGPAFCRYQIIPLFKADSKQP